MTHIRFDGLSNIGSYNHKQKTAPINNITIRLQAKVINFMVS